MNKPTDWVYPSPVLVAEQKDRSGGLDSQTGPARLNPVEAEVVGLFVQLSRLLGQPPSLGEIYGLLFISLHPLAMDDLMERLNVSKGSASQGLKFLRNLGAVRPVEVPGDRRVHYEAVAQLRRLAASFLQNRIEPHLGSGEERLTRLAALARNLPSPQREHALRRIALLQGWGKNGRRVLPLVLKMLDG